MAVIVGRVGVTVGEVPALDVVDEAVAVVVDAVSGDLARIRPDVGREIGVRVVDPGVDDRDQHAGTAGHVPGRGRVHARQAPEILVALSPRARGREERVVGKRLYPQHAVGLAPLDGRVGGVGARHRVEVGAPPHLEDVGTAEVGCDRAGRRALGAEREAPLLDRPSRPGFARRLGREVVGVRAHQRPRAPYAEAAVQGVEAAARHDGADALTRTDRARQADVGARAQLENQPMRRGFGPDVAMPERAAVGVDDLIRSRRRTLRPRYDRAGGGDQAREENGSKHGDETWGASRVHEAAPSTARRGAATKIAPPLLLLDLGP